jgi:hypothetical protein
MFAQRYGVPMRDGYRKAQPDAGRFNFQDRMGGGPMRLGQLMTGGNHPAMQMPGPMTGGPGQIQPMQFSTGGNLPAQVGGSYMPAFNPQTGGQLPPQPFQPMTGGALQAQSGYPQGLAAMFNRYRGF